MNTKPWYMQWTTLSGIGIVCFGIYQITEGNVDMGVGAILGGIAVVRGRKSIEDVKKTILK